MSYVGERLAEMIQEIVWTNKLRRLENTQIDPIDNILRNFLGLYGVVLSQASKWINQGYLMENARLTDSQKIG